MSHQEPPRWCPLLAALTAVLGLSLAGPAAQACACGGVVDRPGFDTTVEGETAVLHWDGRSETIHLQLQARSEAADAGLLLPTPTPATAALGDETMFTDLAAASAPREVQRRHLFGPPLLEGL